VYMLKCKFTDIRLSDGIYNFRIQNMKPQMTIFVNIFCLNIYLLSNVAHYRIRKTNNNKNLAVKSHWYWKEMYETLKSNPEDSSIWFDK